MSELATITDHSPKLDILRAFSAHAKRLGIRAIVMSELSAELGISKKTIYKYYASKEQMVEAMIERWQKRLVSSRDEIAHPTDGDPIRALKGWINLWNSTDAKYSDVFWKDLRKDYPLLYTRYQSAMLERSAEIRRLLNPMLRPGISDEFALRSYAALIEGARKPEFADAVEMTRQQAMLVAVDIWLRGVLTDEALHKMNLDKANLNQTSFQPTLTLKK